MVKGVEVAQTNLDATTIDERTFSSRALSPKSVIEDSGSVTTNGSGVATDKVLHGLAYPPTHLFFFSPGNTNAVLHPGVASWIDREKSTTWGVMDNFTFTVVANASTCDITIQGVPNTLYKYHYFIFAEPAKT